MRLSSILRCPAFVVCLLIPLNSEAQRIPYGGIFPPSPPRPGPKFPMVIEPKEAGQHQVILAVHGHGQVAARAICHSLARLSKEPQWIVCPWGTRQPGPYPYYKFGSSVQAEKKLLQDLLRLKRLHPDRVADGVPVLAGEDDGAVLVTRIASRKPTTFPRLVLVLANRSGVLVSAKGVHVWSKQNLEAFARGGGRSVLYLINGCTRNSKCPETATVCDPLTRHKVSCELLTIPTDTQLSSEDSAVPESRAIFPAAVVDRFAAYLQSTLPRSSPR